MKLKNRVALITGGSSGIGEATARLFSKEGAKCIILDLDETNGKLVADETGGKYFSLDITNRENIKDVIIKIINEYGKIDILVNSAGLSYPSTQIAEFPDDVFDKTMLVNITGTYNMCKAVLANMMKNEYGRIVNVSSAAGIHGTAGKAPYSASKAGINIFTKSLAREVGKQGIIVNAVCPGVIVTPMTLKGGAAVKGSPFYNWWQENCPMGRMGEAEETARLILFFACEDSGFITGQSLLQDGGFV